MNPMRTLFLAGSRSRWLRERAVKTRFVRRAVSRFMPGETLSDALAAAKGLGAKQLGVVLTCLGENVSDSAEASAVVKHYVDALERIRESGLDAEISVKLTQLGLDLGADLAFENLSAITSRAAELKNRVWIDMEDSSYVDRTLDLHARMRKARSNTGVCVQAYLRRTPADLESLVSMGASVRLVKGAYMEPQEIVLPGKSEVDAAYFSLARRLLSEEARKAGVWAAFGTHDRALIRRIIDHAEGSGAPKGSCEFELLYGIQSAEQERLAAAGRKVRVLISYGSYWFPWYMRRLAERPANVLFVLKHMVGAA